MSEEINDYEEDKESAENQIDSNESTETITRVTGMYKEWFLDYASYVILERASWLLFHHPYFLTNSAAPLITKVP